MLFTFTDLTQETTGGGVGDANTGGTRAGIIRRKQGCQPQIIRLELSGERWEGGGGGFSCGVRCPGWTDGWFFLFLSFPSLPPSCLLFFSFFLFSFFPAGGAQCSAAFQLSSVSPPPKCIYTSPKVPSSDHDGPVTFPPPPRPPRLRHDEKKILLRYYRPCDQGGRAKKPYKL